MFTFIGVFILFDIGVSNVANGYFTIIKVKFYACFQGNYDILFYY